MSTHQCVTCGHPVGKLRQAMVRCTNPHQCKFNIRETPSAVTIFLAHRYDETLVIYERDGEFWFSGPAVGIILKCKDPVKSVTIRCAEDDITSLFCLLNKCDSEYGYNPILINENGIQSMVTKSKMHIAKEFSEWITDDVMPSIHNSTCFPVRTKKLCLEKVISQNM